jgi:hypothetical protein
MSFHKGCWHCCIEVCGRDKKVEDGETCESKCGAQGADKSEKEWYGTTWDNVLDFV